MTVPATPAVKPVAPVVAPPPAAYVNPSAEADADIAAFIAEGHNPAEGAPEVDALDSPALAQVPDDQEVNGPDDEQPEAPAATEKKEVAAGAPDAAKLLAAIEKKDLPALIEAMGAAADEMLTSKAHVTLRLQIRDLNKATEAANAQSTRATELATKLADKYGDPIAARAAAEQGDGDSFVALVEKWAGRDWNDVMVWLNKNITGRKERLEAKVKSTPATSTVDPVAQARAMNETREWVSGVLKKSDAPLFDAYPEVVDLVIAEIRTGIKKGIDHPNKALPAVKAQLKAMHEKLSKLFAAPSTRTKTPVVVAKVGTSEGKQAREMTLEETIAETIREAGGAK